MDLNLYAKVTPIETAKDGSKYTYDLTKNNFYQEDHELIKINGGQYHHDGWLFENKGTILLQVAKNAHIEMTTSTGTTTIDHMGGVPTTLTLDIPVRTVVKNLQVKNYIPVDVSNVVITKTISNANKNTYPNEKPENAGTVQITKQTAEGNTGTRYEVGDKVTITTTPSTCYTFQGFNQDGNLLATSTSFEYTVKDGINNIEVIYERQQLYQVIVKPSDPNLGTVSLSPRYDNFYNEKYNDKGEVTQIECWYTAGTQVKATGEAITDYMIDYWKEENRTQHNGISYEFTVGTSNQTTLTAHFALRHPGSVNFVIPEGLLVNGEGQKRILRMQ